MENFHIKDNVNAYKSFFIIYEKYMKNAFEGIVENVDRKNKTLTINAPTGLIELYLA